MIEQYPHIITLTVVTGKTMNANGDWVGGSTETKDIKCRFEPNSKNGFIVGADGNRIEYDGTVYMPLPVDTIAPGTQAQVKHGATVLSKGSVKRFTEGQLNARLWL